MKRMGEGTKFLRTFLMNFSDKKKDKPDQLCKRPERR
jgi:hypothetical protein